MRDEEDLPVEFYLMEEDENNRFSFKSRDVSSDPRAIFIALSKGYDLVDKLSLGISGDE